MQKIILFIVLNMFITFSYSQENAELPPLDPAYEGVHGMALFSHSSTIYASHLPLYHKPHNVQLIYKLSIKDFALLQMVRGADLVTIKPKKFNLQRLMRGEKMTITADVYSGHFERDGMLVYENIELDFSKQLYVREMTDLAKSSKKQQYDMIELRKSNRIYVHRITEQPSFDHILHIDLEAGCLTNFNTTVPVPKEPELLYKFINCGTIKPLYFETEDFVKSAH